MRATINFLTTNWTLISALVTAAIAILQYYGKTRTVKALQVVTHVIEDYSRAKQTDELKQGVAAIAKPSGLNDVIEAVLDGYVRKQFPPITK